MLAGDGGGHQEGDAAMSDPPKRTKSAALYPEPGPKMSREDLESCMIGLPAITRGIPEICVRLNLRERFVRSFLSPKGGIPALPHSPMADGSHIFMTALVIQWLYQYFRPGSQATLRGRPAAVESEEEEAAA